MDEYAQIVEQLRAIQAEIKELNNSIYDDEQSKLVGSVSASSGSLESKGRHITSKRPS